MIVNYKETGWEIITQRAHGLLAVQLAYHWKAAERPDRWVETLIAIAEHDDAEVELDGENLLTPTGGPLNYAMKQFDLEYCTKLSRLSVTKSRYVALLTSMHMQFLYEDEASINEQAKAYLQEQEKLQHTWRRELGITKAQAEKVYALVEWCDAFSLLICRQQMQPEQRAVEISKGPDGKAYQLFQVAEDTLTLDPWPFEQEAFSINYESRIISQLQFSSSAEFRWAFNQAPVQEITWKLVQGKLPHPSKKVSS